MTSDRPSENLAPLIEGFKRLSAVADLVEFHVEFEKEQRASGLRISTFKSAWKAWITQEQDKGGES